MSNLPGLGASRAPFARAVPTAPARDATPTTPASRTAPGADRFDRMLGAMLASNGEPRTSAAGRPNAGERQPTDASTADGAESRALPAGSDESAPWTGTASGTTAFSDAGGATAIEAAVLANVGGSAATAGNGQTLEGEGAAGGAADAAASGVEAATTVETRAAAIAAAAAASPARPARDLDAVDPELRERVARVMERMRDEFGIEVEVTEGYRTQARQNALHAQGRSAPGPVVTWTRHSKHTLGRAVDVTVNGGYSDTRGFATLQRVAREEGLHTLGMRDPGHLELPASVAGSPRPAGMAGGVAGGVDIATLAQLAGDAGARVDGVGVEAEGAALPAAPARAAAVAGVTGPARVASVAEVARVANVARVARVATPGAAATAGAAGTADGGRSGASGVAAASGQPVSRKRDESAGDGRAGEGGEGGEATNGEHGAHFGGDGSRDRGGLPGASRMAPVVGAATADALARLDRIDALRDGSAARPLSHLTLTLDNAAGGSDRIRVDVRGSQMGAVLELSDPVLRDRVSTNLGELQQALEQRGLQSESLHVRRAGVGATEALDMGRIAGATLERENVRAGANAGSGQSSTQHREREDHRQHPDGPRDDSSPRQRSRREPEENQK